MNTVIHPLKKRYRYGMPLDEFRIWKVKGAKVWHAVRQKEQTIIPGDTHVTICKQMVGERYADASRKPYKWAEITCANCRKGLGLPPIKKTRRVLPG